MLSLASQDSQDVGGVVAQNQELRRQVKELSAKLQEVHLENERLAAKLADLTDLSFAKGNLGYVTAGPKGSVNFDNASSIERDSEEEGEQVSYLQQRVATLEDEVSTYKKAIE